MVAVDALFAALVAEPDAEVALVAASVAFVFAVLADEELCCA